MWEISLCNCSKPPWHWAYGCHTYVCVRLVIKISRFLQSQRAAVRLLLYLLGWMVQLWQRDKAGSPVTSSTCSNVMSSLISQESSRLTTNAPASPKVKGCSNFMLQRVVAHTDWVCWIDNPMARIKPNKATSMWAGAIGGGTTRPEGVRWQGLWSCGGQGQEAAVVEIRAEEWDYSDLGAIGLTAQTHSPPAAT